MPLEKDYKDFRVYELLDSGDRQEINAEIETLKDVLHAENVLLLVRYDIRRLFIWKGPKAPVRKRFISSREGSKLQEESAKVGMHLKIISVDAGDEPTDFLDAFKISSYEVKEEDKMEDLVYVRNEERKKKEEAAAAAEANKKKKDANKEYWSPLLEEQKKAEKLAKAKANTEAAQSGGSGNSNIPAQTNSANIPTPNSSSTSAPRIQETPISTNSNRSTIPSTSSNSISSTSSTGSSKTSTPKGLSENESKEVLNSILKEQIPADSKRLNIIIGTYLYGAQKVVTKVFGKEMENEEWNKINNIPEGKIDIESGFIRVYSKNNEIVGIEVLQSSSSDKKAPGASKPQIKENHEESSKTSKKRDLPPIPRGE